MARVAEQPASNAFLYTIAAQSTNNPLLGNPGARHRHQWPGWLTIANLDIDDSQEALLVQGGDLNGTAQPFGTTANPYNSAISLAGGTSVRNVNIGGDGTAAISVAFESQNSTGGDRVHRHNHRQYDADWSIIDRNAGPLNVTMTDALR